MQEIIAHTPLWVFALFFVLVALGMQQTRSRTVTLQRLTLLPLAILALSFYSVWTTFHGNALAAACWLGAVLVTVVASLGFNLARGASYSAATRSFVIPGSRLPLALMTGIFFTKYGVGIMLARHGELATVEAFAAAVSLVYGFWSGMFFSRTAQIVAAHGRAVFA